MAELIYTTWVEWEVQQTSGNIKITEVGSCTILKFKTPLICNDTGLPDILTFN
jgi:hypothetical protein